MTISGQHLILDFRHDLYFFHLCIADEIRKADLLRLSPDSRKDDPSRCITTSLIVKSTWNIRELVFVLYSKEIGVSTMKISEETKKALLKIAAGHTIKDGKERSLEDILKILIEERKAKQK